VAAVLAGIGALLALGSVMLALLPSGGGASVQSGTLGGARLPVGSLLDKPVPDMRLVDDRGHGISLASFRGRYLVLAPSMTLCHEVCPMTAAALEQIKAAVDRDGLGGQVTVAEATVDPWRDSPARLRAYHRELGVGFMSLTGSTAEIERLWKFFGVYYRRVRQGKPPDVDWLTHRPERFDVDHTDGLFIVDPKGHWRVAVIGMPSVGGSLPAPLRRLLNDQGQSNLRHPQAPWTPKQALDDLFDLKASEDASSAAPPPVAHWHGRPGPLLGGGGAAFKTRLAALRGRPVVVNEWASWCPPCRNEFPLFAHASASYGGKVAFLGLNVSDSEGDASAFLRSHPVAYPSYADRTGAIAASYGSASALPTTIFVAPDGRRTYTHIGYYAAQPALDLDIDRYALGR
jgi:cytochrome oxidase Cu insertion factor (SCO1/SenC/PrrC family)/thiol-disulfide isomerase/thioredoxin